MEPQALQRPGSVFLGNLGQDRQKWRNGDLERARLDDARAMTPARRAERDPWGDPAPRFLALTVDLVGSRNLENRVAVQGRLAEAAERLDRELGPVHLAGPVRFNAGDELQALLRRPERAMECLLTLTEAAQPARLRAGLGFGSLEVGHVPEAPEWAADIARLDGPCFHRARAAIEVARREGAWAQALGAGEALDAGLSSLLELLGRLREAWTERQAVTVAAARGRLQKDVAEEFGVSPSVVSEALKAADFDAVLRAEDAVAALLGAAVESGA